MSKKKKEKKVITSCKCQQLRVMIMTHFNIVYYQYKRKCP